MTIGFHFTRFVLLTVSLHVAFTAGWGEEEGDGRGSENRSQRGFIEKVGITHLTGD